MFLFLPYNMIDGKYLLLGTNLGDKKANLSTAINAIKQKIGSILASSSVYETAPWGKIEQPSFLNQVIGIKTDLSPQEILLEIAKIEKMMGRERVIKWGERIIDIDILYYDDKVIDQENLQIPHPGIPNRKFTLIPLAEIAPDFKHPILGLTNNQLLASCEDHLEVKKID